MSGEPPPDNTRRTVRYGQEPAKATAPPVEEEDEIVGDPINDTAEFALDEVSLWAKRNPTAQLPLLGSDPEPTPPPKREPAAPPPGYNPSATSIKTGRHKRIGLLDGRYELGSQLSEGGMGRVYRALHRDLGREFAIKVVLDGQEDDPQTREQFLREARLASALQHPNIVSVTDFGVDDVLGYFLVMELLEGETLRKRLGRGPLPMTFAVEVIDRVALAVRYIHGRGILHGDLKPENVLLASVDGEVKPDYVKLLDFGSSWHKESLPEVDVVGTPPYVAPERYIGESPTPAADVYALGMVLYELLAGDVPFLGSVLEIMKRQLHEVPPPPSRRAREPVSARMDAFVLQSIARNPQDRFPTVEKFHEELRERMHDLGLRRNTSPQPDFDRATEVRPEASPLAILRDSPLPIAVFRADGDLAVASASFMASAHWGPGEAEDFPSLRMTKEQPQLLQAFADAVRTHGFVRQLVVTADRSMQILILAPALSGGEVVSVYATIVATR